MKQFSLIILLLASFLLADTVLAGFGVTPPYIRNLRLSPNAVYEQEINIIRGDPTNDLRAKIIYDVPGAADWISFDKGDEFVLPAGQTKTKLMAIVKVPKKADYGTYRGKIHLNAEPVDLEEGLVNIALGSQIDVDLEVSKNEIFEFAVRSIKLPNIETGGKFLWWDLKGKIKLLINYENKGNIASAPTKVVLDIFDTRGNLVEQLENYKKIDKVEPFATEEVAARFKTELPPGSYIAEIKVYRNDEVMYQSESTLNIVPEGGLPDQKNLTWLYWLLPTLVVIAGAAYYAWTRRSKKRKK